MRATIPDGVGLKAGQVCCVHVMWTVRLSGVRVFMAFDTVAQQAAGLRPTRLGVMDGRGSC